MLLGILNSALDNQLAANPDLVYSLLYKREVFEQSQDLCHIGDGIRRGKRNPFSAEVSSLYGLFKGEHLDPDDCRIVLLATDSSDGVFAARLNKRGIAHRLLGYGEEAVLAW